MSYLMIEGLLVSQTKDTSLPDVPFVLLWISKEITQFLIKTKIDSSVTPF